MKKMWLFLLFLPMLSLAGNVAVNSDKIIYQDGGEIVITVANNTGQRIFLPRCDAVSFEQFTGKKFEVLPPLFCESEGDPLIIAAGAEHEIRLDPKFRGESHIRPVVTFALGCRKGVPLELAECKNITFERGRYFTFKGRPSKGR